MTYSENPPNNPQDHFFIDSLIDQYLAYIFMKVELESEMEEILNRTNSINDIPTSYFDVMNELKEVAMEVDQSYKLFQHYKFRNS